MPCSTPPPRGPPRPPKPPGPAAAAEPVQGHGPLAAGRRSTLAGRRAARAGTGCRARGGDCTATGGHDQRHPDTGGYATRFAARLRKDRLLTRRERRRRAVPELAHVLDHANSSLVRRPATMTIEHAPEGNLKRNCEAGYDVSWRRASAESRLPSARPATTGVSAFITAPSPCGPAAPVSAMAWVDQVGELGVAQLCRQVAVEHLGLSELLVGQLGPVAGGEHLGRLTPLLGLLCQYGKDIGVGERTRRLAGDLFSLDRGECHPQRADDQVVVRAQRRDHVVVQALCQGAHVVVPLIGHLHRPPGGYPIKAGTTSRPESTTVGSSREHADRPHHRGAIDAPSCPPFQRRAVAALLTAATAPLAFVTLSAAAPAAAHAGGCTAITVIGVRGTGAPAGQAPPQRQHLRQWRAGQRSDDRHGHQPRYGLQRQLRGHQLPRHLHHDCRPVLPGLLLGERSCRRPESAG